MAKKCTVILLIFFPLINFGQTYTAEFTPFTDDLLDERTIYIIDPLSKKILTSFIPSDYQLITNIEGFVNEVEDLVHTLAHGSKSEPGYNKPMILDRIDENGEIIKGRPKISIDEQLLVEKIIESSFSGGKIELPLLYTESDYMEVDIPYLNQVVLASYTTIFNSNSTGRSKNIELSSIAINNVIVGNGDIFSFNSVVGPREVATGYQKAPEIVKGKLVMGIGGGICQTSSTLFNAIDTLNIESIERHHHSRDVGYVPKGRDATVSFGGLDYQFQNTTGIPFIIKTIYRKGSITVQIRTSQEYANILRNELSLKKKGETLSFFCSDRIFLANMEYIHYDFYERGIILNNFTTITNWLKSSKKIVILTGAGMSTESGIPDFRSSSGWWKNIDPQTVATVTALENNYDLFHEFYTMRLNALEQCHPHEGHHILADWEKNGIVHSIATQNVDGFHLRAGSNNVQELHGSIQTFRCHKCTKPSTKEVFIKKEACLKCGGKLRPNVVLFGETLPEQSWKIALKNIQQSDLVIVIGTSLEVYPVNQLPTMTNGKTVYINKEYNSIASYFNLTIEGKAKETLQKINQLL